jgi:perosamine synthetase
MSSLLKISREFGLSVIEDATESLGAEYQQRHVGSLGDIACFSFNGNKLITTGGGGMIVTDNGSWADKAKYLTTQAKDDPLEYVHSEIGYNYRLTNIQAAMGVAQMEQLDSYIDAKRRIAETYNRAFSEAPGIRPLGEASWAKSVYWMYTVLVDSEIFGMSSRNLMRALERANTQTRPLWQPLHLSQAHKGAFSTDCSVAEYLNREALSLPCSVGLSGNDQQSVIERIYTISEHRCETLEAEHLSSS